MVITALNLESFYARKTVHIYRLQTREIRTPNLFEELQHVSEQASAPSLRTVQR